MMDIDLSSRQALDWRLIGPHRGGRVVAVAGDPVSSQVFYFGSTGGGVWKTKDGGVTWHNVSDGFFKRASVGAIAVAPSDPNVVYVGMGEATIRGNVSHGDGVYRSTDGGKTWTHLALADTRHIARIRIHPSDPDTLYVAAFGHAFGPNEERGIYRSRDGGRSWSRILYGGERAGAIDLSLNVSNPRILFAALWEAERTPWSLSSGGPGSGLFRSTDGGDTWAEISRNPGLPLGLLGKIGVAVSPADGERVWTLVESERGGLFRSDDGGERWTLVSAFPELRQRPWYYMHVVPDPQDRETVWVLNLRAWRSVDGGRTFSGVDIPHVDNHDLWIDPRNPLRMIEGSDGGATVSFNGGASWSSLYNQPTAEFYHVTTDNQIPYRVYGPQQDNTAISLPSFSTYGAITPAEWYEPGGGESGYIAVHPHDPNVVFAGSYSGTITRYDHRTLQSQDITVWPENPTGWGAKDLRYRFQWTFPIQISPHDPSVVHATGNHVFRTRDGGHSWETISPDLTRHEPHTLEPSGGPITKDNVSTENYATIFAFAESPLTPGLLWAGADDGLVHLSRDGGASWLNVTPPTALLPDWALISIIEPSPHDPATAYLAATRYKLDDFRPYFLKTADYGASWQVITAGIPADDFSRVIREDPKRQGLLYAGTETGLSVSFDDGGHWQRLGGNLPVVPIHDLVVKDDDLVLATHGRAFWILDDISPLRGLSPEVVDTPAHLFPPRPTYRLKAYWSAGAIPQGTYRRAGTLVVTYRDRELPTGEVTQDPVDAGRNGPTGVVVNYYLKQPPSGDLRLRFLDADGRVIAGFTPRGPDGAAGTSVPRLPVEPGLNRFVWNMRYPDAEPVPGAVFWAGSTQGPLVAPGSYRVELSVDGQTFTAPFDILKDPRVPASEADLREQAALLLEIRDELSAVHQGVNRIRNLRRQIDEWSARAERTPGGAGLREAADALRRDMVSIEEELIQNRAEVTYDTLALPIKLNNKLAALMGVVAHADAAPTKQARETFAYLRVQADREIERLKSLVEHDLSDFNAQIREVGIAPIVHLGSSSSRF